MQDQQEIVLLADTNVAYKIYFFMKKDIIPCENIFIEGCGYLLFHEIVLIEAKAHYIAYKELKKNKLPSSDVPQFFSKIKNSEVKELIKFIETNIDKSTKKEQPHNQDFRRKKKAYEKERLDLQKSWVAQGLKTKKVTSKPSANDYNLLYSASHKNYKLVTHDEILYAVASEFLDDGFTLRTEDIISHILRKNPELEVPIQEALDNLKFIGEKINKTKVLRHKKK